MENIIKKLFRENFKWGTIKKISQKIWVWRTYKYFDPSIGISQTISLNETDTEFLIGAMGNEIADQDLGLHYIKLNKKEIK